MLLVAIFEISATYAKLVYWQEYANKSAFSTVAKNRSNGNTSDGNEKCTYASKRPKLAALGGRHYSTGNPPSCVFTCSRNSDKITFKTIVEHH